MTIAGGSRPAPDRTLRGGRRTTSSVPEELVTAAQAGDRAAIAQVLERVRPTIARYCRARLERAAWSALSADDVTQDACLALLAALPRYRRESAAFLAFVHGIAAHKVVDAQRSLVRTRSRPVADVPDVVAPDPGPEQHVLRDELATRLTALLEELPVVQRRILASRILHGLSVAETARAVGATPGAVRVAQHRALKWLRTTVAPPPLTA